LTSIFIDLNAYIIITDINMGGKIWIEVQEIDFRFNKALLNRLVGEITVTLKHVR